MVWEVLGEGFACPPRSGSEFWKYDKAIRPSFYLISLDKGAHTSIFLKLLGSIDLFRGWNQSYALSLKDSISYKSQCMFSLSQVRTDWRVCIDMCSFRSYSPLGLSFVLLSLQIVVRFELFYGVILLVYLFHPVHGHLWPYSYILVGTGCLGAYICGACIHVILSIFQVRTTSLFGTERKCNLIRISKKRLRQPSIDIY